VCSSDLVQDWEVFINEDGFITIRSGEAEHELYHTPEARELTLTFDQNMNPMVAWMAGDVLYYRWYDPVSEDYSVDTIAGRSPFLTHDDKRKESVALGTTDILLFYIKGSTLCYRVQRDRYQIEYVSVIFAGPRLWIRRCGMNKQYRMQIEVLGSDAKVIS
jgi:hypothetical protein